MLRFAHRGGVEGKKKKKNVCILFFCSCASRTNASGKPTTVAFKRLHLADLGPEPGVCAYRALKKKNEPISSCNILTRKSSRKLQLSHRCSLLPVLRVLIVAATTCSRRHPCDGRIPPRCSSTSPSTELTAAVIQCLKMFLQHLLQSPETVVH